MELDNRIDLRTIESLKEMNFYIPNYQRGYRWGKEATRLLDDIMEIADSDYRYCLQPIVVKKLSDENSYELIDGQQRLTTLFLIYKFIKKLLPFIEINYSLTYTVRKDSEEFLKNISEKSEETNIDFYFMKEAYMSIDNWFQEKMKQRISIPFSILKEVSEDLFSNASRTALSSKLCER